MTLLSLVEQQSVNCPQTNFERFHHAPYVRLWHKTRRTENWTRLLESLTYNLHIAIQYQWCPWFIRSSSSSRRRKHTRLLEWLLYCTRALNETHMRAIGSTSKVKFLRFASVKISAVSRETDRSSRIPLGSIGKYNVTSSRSWGGSERSIATVLTSLVLLRSLDWHHRRKI